ncbi:pseudouridine synthase [Fictibacillus aquaticus]|uniref:Pseudouridine synthase n=1 Tax=Fictibacillus aquaticus TaxID=2021314 RepID=A0A235F8S9_9BACL|nr:pseudouridine synthase [Fictibacillus aquaticus]OYD57761.1 23S rRNA pseudouridine synthase F [Fictibacillus aquaticus]
MRIQKYMSETGRFSRRETDRLIKAGRIMVNGEACHKDSLIAADDVVMVDGERVERQQDVRGVYILLNKPRGITTTAQPAVEGNIIDFVGHSERIFPVGRLDKDSEGLMLLTNDGSIVNNIMKSEFGHEKEYEVTVDQPVTQLFLDKMAAGVEILGGVRTLPCRTWQVSPYVFRIVLTQGLNRQIRRMCKTLGYNVIRLKRVRLMNLTLNGLETGEWRELKAAELQEMNDLLSGES